MARSFSTKPIAVYPLSLTVSIWTLSDSVLVISGRFNCLSGDITFFVASEADIERCGLTGVSSFLFVLRSLMHTTHLNVDLPEEFRNT
jgi:hypothetical protein